MTNVRRKHQRRNKTIVCVAGAALAVGMRDERHAIQTFGGWPGRTRRPGRRGGQENVLVEVLFGQLSDNTLVVQLGQNAVDLGLQSRGALGEGDGISLLVETLAHDLDVVLLHSQLGRLGVKDRQIHTILYQVAESIRGRS